MKQALPATSNAVLRPVQEYIHTEYRIHSLHSRTAALPIQVWILPISSWDHFPPSDTINRSTKQEAGNKQTLRPGGKQTSRRPGYFNAVHLVFNSNSSSSLPFLPSNILPIYISLHITTDLLDLLPPLFLFSFSRHLVFS